MAHGVGEAVSVGSNTMKMSQNNHHCLQQQQQQQQTSSQNSRKNVGVMGSRRIFAAAFKLKVLDSYRSDIDCRGNQRATARKYGIHRRQIQKWLQCEDNLRSSCAESNATTTVTSSGCCTVPVGSSNTRSNVATSPVLSVVVQGETISKSDVTNTTSSSASSPSASSINSNSNSPIATIGVSACAGTPIATPVTATAAPALNLSLARLHGDEQHQQVTARQGLPPHLPSGTPGVPAAPVHHSGRRGSSPTSPQYLQHNNNQHPQVPSSSSPNNVRGMLVGYTEYATPQDSLHHQRDGMIQDPSNSPERKYSYVMNSRSTNYDNHEILRSTGSIRSSNSDTYYQSLESYHNSASFAGLRNNNNNNNNNNNANVKEIGLGSAISPSYQDKRNNVESAGNACEPPQLQPQSTSFASSSSPLLLLHATTIKSERASPDSLATPGPCETPGSPESAASFPRSRVHHQQQQYNPPQQQQSLVRRLNDASSDTCNANRYDVCNTNTNKNLVNGTTVVATSATAIATDSAAVHLNETTRPLAHVHVSVDSHAFNTRDSEKQQREREQQQRQQLHRDSTKVEYEDRMRRRVKEEVVEREEFETTTSTSCNATPTMSMITMMSREAKREISEEETIGEGSRYHRERTTTNVAVPCTDYQGVTAQAVSTGSGPVSPVIRDTSGSYSGLSSPRAASSSGISTSSSCSDSEIDPLDYSSSSARNAINDLSRRRSFSLRFKLDVLDAFHGDVGVAGNQRATARKFGINRRQVQKWLGQESELRGEIALRGGDLRQRLGPISETNSNESPLAVDLRTSSTTNFPISVMRSDGELDHSSPPLYCCDVGSSSQRLGYYHQGSIAESSEMPPKPCTLSCCVDNLNTASMICYQESTTRRRSSIGYPESQGSLYCYSPRDPLENGSTVDGADVNSSSSPLKRYACTLTYCYDSMPSPKRICLESVEEQQRASPVPPQDVPLCLVKPKRNLDESSMQIEPVTSTVPTPPAQLVVPPAATPVSKKDAILFKPYLDNPVSKPTEDTRLSPHPNHRGLSPLSAQSVIVNNNNNCHSICNLNEERSSVPSTQHDYALELSLRVPVSWRTHHGGYSEFPESLKSAFVRYPTSPHYT